MVSTFPWPAKPRKNRGAVRQRCWLSWSSPRPSERSDRGLPWKPFSGPLSVGFWKLPANTLQTPIDANVQPSPGPLGGEPVSIRTRTFAPGPRRAYRGVPALAAHAFASVLRAADEEPGSQAVVCDECGGDAGLRLRIAEWRRPSEGAIAFRLWTASLYLLKSLSDRVLANHHNNNPGYRLILHVGSDRLFNSHSPFTAAHVCHAHR